jgi:hypothetical protein
MQTSPTNEWVNYFGAPRIQIFGLRNILQEDTHISTNFESSNLQSLISNYALGGCYVLKI